MGSQDGERLLVITTISFSPTAVSGVTNSSIVSSKHCRRTRIAPALPERAQAHEFPSTKYEYTAKSKRPLRAYPAVDGSQYAVNSALLALGLLQAGHGQGWGGLPVTGVHGPRETSRGASCLADNHHQTQPAHTISTPRQEDRGLINHLVGAKSASW